MHQLLLLLQHLGQLLKTFSLYHHGIPTILPQERGPALPSGSRKRMGSPGEAEATPFLRPSELFPCEGAICERKALGGLGCGMWPGRERGLIQPKAGGRG